MSGFALTITQKRQNFRIYKMMEEEPRRVQSIIDHYSMSVAKAALPVLQGMAPRDIPRYADLLQAVRFKLGNIQAAGIMVPGYARHARLTERDAQRTVLFIKPKMKGGAAMDPASVVLWRSNPWTMETLPFEPSKRVATIISRRVRAKETYAVEQARTAQRAQIDRELRTLGVTIQRKHPVLLERRVERDLAWEILRREFGIGDSPHVAHWRPAMRYAKTTLAKQVLKGYLRWLTVPSEKRWRKPLQGKPGKVSDVRRALAFQSHIRA
jgi:hypothetical protein